MKQHQRGCCRERSILERILIVVVVLLFCLLIALFTVFVLHRQEDKDYKFQLSSNVPSTEKTVEILTANSLVRRRDINVCMTHQCVQASSQILDFIDPSIEPCDNFYSFVCGTFLNQSIEKNEITPINKLEAITLRQVDSLITEPIKGPIPKAWELQRRYYKACMNTDAIENDNGQTFSKLIKELGDWPVLFGRFWDERKFSWMTSMIKCRKLGFSYDQFLTVAASEGGNGTGPILLVITPPTVISLPFQYRELYIDVMANISIELDAPPYLAKNEFIRVFKFVEQLKLLVQDETENGSEIIISVQQLQNDYSFIPWEFFLNEITRTSKPFTKKTLVRLRAGRYLKNLFNLIETTPKSIQANYIVWKIIENFRSYLKETVRGRYESFLATVNPDYAFLGNRFAYCLDKAKFYFPSVVELAYVRKYLRPSKRKEVKEMIAKIKDELKNVIHTSEWLDEESKQVSEDKLDTLEEIIGSSDKAYNGDFDEIVDMDEFELETGNILEMATKLNAKRIDNYFKMVNEDLEVVARNTLKKTPILTINPFYHADFNSLVIPAPFIQGIIYNFVRPQYMNYGALGSIIGHELIHSFVSDKNDTEKNEPRWSTRSIRNYEKKFNCLMEGYPLENDHLKEFTKQAQLSLEENVADFLGRHLAYQAYRQQISSLGSEPTLPSLDYTPEQLFWIMSGIYRCYQPRVQENILLDQQLVPSHGVISSMRNSETFSADFNCPIGSNMNPKKKCQII